MSVPKSDRFLATVVNLGALGVITKVTLVLQPTYQVKQFDPKGKFRNQFVQDNIFGG